MEKLISIVEKVSPLLASYPRPVQFLFLTTFALSLASAFCFAVLYPAAQDRLGQQKTRKAIAMDVSAMQPVEAPADETVVGYSVSRTSDGIAIAPRMGYLEKLARGGPVAALTFWWVPFELSLPRLDIKVVNNSSETIFFTAARLELERSVPDDSPVLYIVADKGRNNPFHFRLENDGWGTAEQCAVHYGVLPLLEEQRSRNDAIMSGKAFPGGPYPHTTQVGSVGEDGANVDVTQGIVAGGVKLAELEALRWREKRGSNQRGEVILENGERVDEEQYQARQRAAYGPFRDNAALVFGEITYVGKNAAGEVAAKALRFSTVVVLQAENRAGAPSPPSFDYDAMLNAEGSQYVVDVPISQSLKPGETDRFTIRMAVPRSSAHSLRVRLLYNDGASVLSVPISMRIFLPRSALAHLASGRVKDAGGGPR